MKRYNHEPRHDRKDTELNPYQWGIYQLEPIDVLYFWERFEIDSRWSLKYVRRTPWDAYLLPIMKPSGDAPGYVMRKGWSPGDSGVECPRKHLGAGGPKSITYMHQKGEYCAYYAPMGVPRTPTVIVEDQISAIKCASAGYRAWALLGVFMDVNKAREISSLRPQEVVFALDPDASANSFELARKWGLAFPKCRVALLERDLKDTATADIQLILGDA